MEEYTENLNITGPINILMKPWNISSEETYLGTHINILQP